jgi:hypothetical protein
MTKRQFKRFRIFVLWFLFAMSLIYGGISLFMFIFAGMIIFLGFFVLSLITIFLVVRELRSWATGHPVCKAYYELPD